jgi:hypothetical protein
MSGYCVTDDAWSWPVDKHTFHMIPSNISDQNYVFFSRFSHQLSALPSDAGERKSNKICHISKAGIAQSVSVGITTD